jgi:hypothetical protein
VGAKVILFSDLHLTEDSADTVFNEVLPGIEQAALADDRDIGFLGDWWHIRYKVSVALLNRTHEWLLGLLDKQIHLRLLPGNHDQINVAGENALDVFGGLPHVKVYSIPQWDGDGLWIPYRQDPKDIEKALATPGGSKGVLFMHHGVRGAMQNDQVQNTEGLPVGAFSQFGCIWCGHYHMRQNVGKTLCYVGSPYQTRANEAGQNKGYTILHGNTFQHVTTRWGKRYHMLELDNYRSGKLPLPDGIDLARDEIRIKTKAGVNPEAVGKALVKLGSINHVVTPEVEAGDQRLPVAAGAGLQDFVKAYVAKHAVGDESEAPRLMRVFDEIVGVRS